jgi:hypothetical protein
MYVTTTLKGELEHRRVKANYRCAQKNNFTQQITTLDRRQAHLRTIMENLNRFEATQSSDLDTATQDNANVDLLPFSDPELLYHMAKRSHKSEDINAWLLRHSEDPATDVCTYIYPSGGRIIFADHKPFVGFSLQTQGSYLGATFWPCF